MNKIKIELDFELCPLIMCKMLIRGVLWHYLEFLKSNLTNFDFEISYLVFQSDVPYLFIKCFLLDFRASDTSKYTCILSILMQLRILI
jgi:hypothetical protein